MRHLQAGFSSRRQKGVAFCRAALPGLWLTGCFTVPNMTQAAKQR